MIGLLIVIEVKDYDSGKKVILRTNECVINNKLSPFDVMFTSTLTKMYDLLDMFLSYS